MESSKLYESNSYGTLHCSYGILVKQGHIAYTLKIFISNL